MVRPSVDHGGTQEDLVFRQTGHGGPLRRRTAYAYRRLIKVPSPYRSGFHQAF